MTQEEKAKAYDEALEKARKLYNDAKANEYMSDMEDYESIFPELAESEDERIRKEIVSIVQSYRDSCISEGTHRFDDCLAWLEKQKDLDKMIVISPEVWDNAITDAYENGKRDSEKQKEQKPVESISQLTVQGKGVYKICPRCKERMVRDDSMVYTSMPPQYRYECPKCGESECDTVMYDNPEMGKQKPADLSEMMVHKEPYIAPVPTPMVADEQKPVKPSGKLSRQDYLYQLLIDQLITYSDYEYLIGQKPAEWSEEDEKMLKCCLIAINHYEKTCNIGDHLPTKFNIDGYLASVDKVKSWLKSLRPHWKPSEEQMEALKCAIEDIAKFSKRGGRQVELENEPYYSALHSLYCNLEKLM